MVVNDSLNYDKVRRCTLFNKKENSNYESREYVSEDKYCIAAIKYKIEEINCETRPYW